MLILGGALFLHKNISAVARWVSQTGSSNPKIEERVKQLPYVLILTGTEMVVWAAWRRRGKKEWPWIPSEALISWNLTQRLMLAVLTIHLLIGVLTLNLSAVSTGLQLTSSLHEGEKVRKDFGDAAPLIDMIRQETPADAGILIHTQRPLKYLLNYELYPRRFYFISGVEASPMGAAPEWMRKHHIGWVLIIPDDEPFRFRLVKNQDQE